jgi:hypothetical protein
MGSPHACAGSSSTKFITYLIITEKETMFYVTTRLGAAKAIARMTNYTESGISWKNDKEPKCESAKGTGYTACLSKVLIMVYGELFSR